MRSLAESLFWDKEYGIASNLALIDESETRERYVASYLPEESAYIIDKCTAWESLGEDDDFTYLIATEAETHGTFETAEEAAAELLELARKHNLVPSLGLLFDQLF